MKKYLTYKYRIYPNKKQKEQIELTFTMCRYMYNTLLRIKADFIKQYIIYSENCRQNNTKIDSKFFSQKHKLPKMSELKKIDERYYKVDSLALCAELHNINRAFKNFYSGRANFPKYKKRKDRNTYITSNVNYNIRIENERKIRLPKLSYVKAKIHRCIPENSKIKRAIIFEDKIGKYYVELVLEIEMELENQIYLDEERFVGLDFKVGEIFVTSEGGETDFERPFKRSLEKLRDCEVQLKRKSRFSKGYWKQVDEIRRYHKKVVNKRTDFLHKASRNISNKYDFVGIEDISLKEIAKNLSTGINVYETGYKNFVEMLRYKTCGNVITVSKWFPSTKLCSNCGNKKKKMKLDTRIYRCRKCGLVIDRDVNAAINIKEEAKRLLELNS